MLLLSFKKHFDTTINIGDLQLPIKVARLNRAQLAEVDAGWDRLVVKPRGSIKALPTNATEEERDAHKEAVSAENAAWNKQVHEERFQFLSEVISKYVTVDEGIIEDGGVSVTDGDGLVRLFHVRWFDVLIMLVDAVQVQNRLTPMLLKNSKSPSVSAIGSAPSTLEPTGSKPEQTATNAGPFNTAPVEAATDKNRSTTDELPSSGPFDEEEALTHSN